MNLKNKIVYITGGSEGIGFAFAMECASRNHNLILVALDKRKLIEAQNRINKKYDVSRAV